MRSHFKIPFYFILFSSLILSMSSISSAYAHNHREHLINKSLNCYQEASASDSLSYNDICYMDAEQEREKTISDALDRTKRGRASADSTPTAKLPVQNRSYVLPAQNYTVISPRPRVQTASNRYEQTEAKTTTKDKDSFTTIFRNENISSEITVGSEVYLYHYSEPTLNVSLSGQYYGGVGSYTLRTQENKPLTAFKDVFSKDSHINVFKVEGRVGIGYVDYQGSGTYDGLDDLVFEIRGLAGYDLPVSTNMLCTPYFGLGYRYLSNGMDEIPAQTIGGVNYYSGYERESKYYYFPIGFDLSQKYESNWSWNLNLEYDVFIRGDQDTHLEDMEDLNGNNPNFSTLQNDQKHGYGIRSSLKITKSSEHYDLFAEPFVRYWKIDSSNTTFSCSGDTGTCLAGYEPKNDTREYGLKFGINFN